MQSIPRDVSNKLASMSLLGAIFVVFIHIWTPTPPGSFAWWLYSLTSMRKMAVPLFFLISGFLLAGHVSDEDWWKQENSKRVKSLLIPYVLWSVLWMLFLVFRQLLGNYVQGHPLLDGVLLIVTDHRFLGLDLFSHPQMVPLWYVRALIILVFFSPVVVWLLKRCPRRFLCCAFLCAIFDRCAGGTYFYLIGSTFSISYLFYFALAKYENQTQEGSGFLKILMSGRQEFFMAIPAALDKPIVGHGPFASDTKGYVEEFIYKYGSALQVRFYEAGKQQANLLGYKMPIPSHSHIMGAWVHYGLFGLIFYLWVIFVIIRHFKKYAGAIPQWYGYFALTLCQFMWEVFFSAFSSRDYFALMMTCLFFARAVGSGRLLLPPEMEMEILKADRG